MFILPRLQILKKLPLLSLMTIIMSMMIIPATSNAHVITFPEIRKCTNFRQVHFFNNTECEIQNAFKPLNGGARLSTSNYTQGTFLIQCRIEVTGDSDKVAVELKSSTWEVFDNLGDGNTTPLAINIWLPKSGTHFHAYRQPMKNGLPKKSEYQGRTIVENRSSDDDILNVKIRVRDPWRGEGRVTAKIGELFVSFDPQCPID